MVKPPQLPLKLSTTIAHYACCAAVLLWPLAPDFASAASPACSGVTDPSISCEEVQPPGMTSPGVPQQPGFERRNTESGNLLTALPIGGSVSIFHSSQSLELQNGKPRDDEGFGEGFVAVGRLTPMTSSGGYTIERRASDGAIIRYSRKSSGPFLSENREFGDTTQVVGISGGFEVQLPDGTRYLYTTKIGESYYPTKAIDPLGRETQFSFTGKVLTQVKDVALNRVTSLSLGSDGHVSEVTDFNGLKTRLSYQNGQLTGVTYPDGKGYTLTYDRDGFGFITQSTTPDNSTNSYAYYQFGILRAIGQDDRLATFAYKPDEVVTETSVGGATLQFSRIKFSGGHPSESWGGDGSLSEAAVLTSKETYSGHRLTQSVDAFGRVEKLFYNLDSSCEAPASGAEQSPLPTCVRSPDGTTTQTYRNWSLFGAPTKVVVTGPGGVSPIVSEFEYAGPGRLTSAKTTRDGIETSRQEITYQGLLPVSTTSTGLTKVLAFDQVVKGRALKVLTPGGSQIESQFSPLGVLTSSTVDGVAVSSEYGEAASGQATYSSSGGGVSASGHSNFDGTQSDGLIKGAGTQTALSLGAGPGASFAANAVEGQIRARMNAGFLADSLQARLESEHPSQASQLVPRAEVSWKSSTDVGVSAVSSSTTSKVSSGASASSWRTDSNVSWSTTDNSSTFSSSSGYK